MTISFTGAHFIQGSSSWFSSREAHLFWSLHSRGSLSSRLCKTLDESEDLSHYPKVRGEFQPNKYLVFYTWQKITVNFSNNKWGFLIFQTVAQGWGGPLIAEIYYNFFFELYVPLSYHKSFMQNKKFVENLILNHPGNENKQAFTFCYWCLFYLNICRWSACAFRGKEKRVETVIHNQFCQCKQLHSTRGHPLLMSTFNSQEHLIHRHTWLTDTPDLQTHLTHRHTWLTDTPDLQTHLTQRHTWLTDTPDSQTHLTHRHT